MKILVYQDDTAVKNFKMTEELLPRIIVKDPVIHDSWEQGKFTTYLICIKTEHPAFHLRLSAVRRRFSELIWLYKVLKANHSYVRFPKVPSKKVFAERFEPDFINARMLEIQIFLNDLLVTDTVLADAAFHFFVQTDLTTDEIDEYLHGTLPETIVKEAWENAGHLHTSSYIVNTTVIPHEPQEIFMNEEDLHAQQVSRSANSGSSFKDTSLFVPETEKELSDTVVSASSSNDEAADLTNEDEVFTSSCNSAANGDDIEEQAAELDERSSEPEGISDNAEVLNHLENDVRKVALSAQKV